MTQHRSGGDRSTRTRRNQAPLPKNPRRGPAAGAQREGACRAPCDCVYAARESERASETACARASTDRQATAATHQASLQPLIEQPTGSEGARDLVTDVTDSAHEPSEMPSPPEWGLGRTLANKDRDATADYRERQGGDGGLSRSSTYTRCAPT